MHWHPIHFYIAVRSIVFKLTKGEAPDTDQMNVKVPEMIHEAMVSEGVEEIFKLGDSGEKEVDIFNEDYLAKIDKIKLPNTKIKLLQKLLNCCMRLANYIKGLESGLSVRKPRPNPFNSFYILFCPV